MRNTFTNGMIDQDVRAEAGRFYDAYYYFFTLVKQNRHAITGQ